MRPHICPLCNALWTDSVFLNRAKRQVKWKGGKVNFTPLEFELLDLLFLRPRTAEELSLNLYDRDEPEDPLNNISVFVCRIRRKFKEAAFPGQLLSRQGPRGDRGRATYHLEIAKRRSAKSRAREHAI